MAMPTTPPGILTELRDTRGRRRGIAFALVTAVALAHLLAASGTATARSDATDPALSHDSGFAAFVEALRPEALKQGVSRAAWQRALPYLAWRPEILPRISAQPEHTRSTGAYVRALVSPARIAAGRAALTAHGDTLAAVESRTGVDRHVLLAIWGIETNYGATTGGHNVLAALATLAYADPRRAAFWRRELIAALAIVSSGDIAPEAMSGSWAGAMGLTQFMPSTYRRHAVDFDGDNRRDIWRSPADALASAANYLRRSGWQSGAPWTIEMTLPAGFDFDHADPSATLPLEAWQLIGLTRPAGRAWPQSAELFRLLLPAGAQGPALLVGANHRAILRYNASTSYALSVGLLADALRGAPPLAASWPLEDRGLGREERRELQERLLALGHDTGGVDAVLGRQTRAAIRAFQRANGLPIDGHPSARLLSILRGQ